MTAKITTDPLTENYQQAGLRVYQDDNNWASIHMIYAGTGRDFEFIYENDGNPRNEAADKLGGIPADAPTDLLGRAGPTAPSCARSTATTARRSTRSAAPRDISGWAAPQIGPVALSDQAADVPGRALRLDPLQPGSSRCGGGGGGGSSSSTSSTARRWAPRWDVVRQDQADDASAAARCASRPQPGDIYGRRRNNAKNLVMRDAPDGPWVATTKMNFKGAAQYHQAGIVVYGNDDNFTKFGRIATNAAGSALAEKFEFIYENAGTPRNDAADSTANLAGGRSRTTTGCGSRPTGRNITGAVLDRRQRVDAPSAARRRCRRTPRSACSRSATPATTAARWPRSTRSRSPVTTSAAARPARAATTSSTGAALDKTRWNAIVRDTPAAYAVSGGNLTITT